MERQSFMIGVDRLYLAEILSDTVDTTLYDTPFSVPGISAIGVKMSNMNLTIYADDGACENINNHGNQPCKHLCYC